MKKAQLKEIIRKGIEIRNEHLPISEDFKSKAQQKYLYSTNPEAAEKLDSKMTKKDYKNLPDKVNEKLKSTEKYAGSAATKSTKEYLNQNKKDSVDEEMDINDPVLVASRAAKMRTDKILSQPQGDEAWPTSTKVKKDNSSKIAFLEKEREQLMMDMEQEAEPEGGTIADRYGAQLNRIDKAIAKLSGRQKMTYDQAIAESVNEILSKEDRLKIAKSSLVKAEKDGDDNLKKRALATIDLIKKESVNEGFTKKEWDVEWKMPKDNLFNATKTIDAVKNRFDAIQGLLKLNPEELQAFENNTEHPAYDMSYDELMRWYYQIMKEPVNENVPDDGDVYGWYWPIADKAIEMLKKDSKYSESSLGAVGSGDGSTYISITVDFPSGSEEHFDVFFDGEEGNEQVTNIESTFVSEGKKPVNEVDVNSSHKSFVNDIYKAVGVIDNILSKNRPPSIPEDIWGKLYGMAGDITDKADQLLTNSEPVNESRTSTISKRRAQAELKQKLKGTRSDGMGKYTATVYGLDKDGKRVELKSTNDLNKYSKFEIGESVNESEDYAGETFTDRRMRIKKELRTKEEAANTLFGDESLIDQTRLNPYMSIKLFPQSYKGGEDLTMYTEREGNESLHDVTIEEFIKILDRENLFLDKSKFEISLRTIFSKSVNESVNENTNPEVYKSVDRFIKAMAKRYGYEEEDALFAIRAALKEREYNVDVFGSSMEINEASTRADFYKLIEKEAFTAGWDSYEENANVEDAWYRFSAQQDSAQEEPKSYAKGGGSDFIDPMGLHEGHSLEGKDLDLLKSLKSEIDQGVLNSKKKDAYVALLNGLINTNVNESLPKGFWDKKMKAKQSK